MVLHPTKMVDSLSFSDYNKASGVASSWEFYDSINFKCADEANDSLIERCQQGAFGF